MVYLITGRKHSGKTTLANKLKIELEKENKKVLILDGDDIRSYFSCGFSYEDRKENILRMAKIASLVEKQNFVVIIAAVTPYVELRQEIKNLCKECKLIYLEGGELWPNAYYETPNENELFDWNGNSKWNIINNYPELNLRKEKTNDNC